MSTFQSVITNVQPRLVNTRDGRSFTLLEVIDQQGVAWVAREDVANIARGLIGQPAAWTTRQEQKGNFLNRYLDYIAPLGAPTAPQQPPQPQPQQQPPPYIEQAREAAQRAQQAQAPQPEPPAYVTTEKDRQIHRQVAAKVASVLQPTTADEFWSNVQDLERYFTYGNTPEQVKLTQAMTGRDGPDPEAEEIPF